MGAAFDIPMWGTSSSRRYLCGELFRNIRAAYVQPEQRQGPTLFRASVSEGEIQQVTPETTRSSSEDDWSRETRMGCAWAVTNRESKGRG